MTEWKNWMFELKFDLIMTLKVKLNHVFGELWCPSHTKMFLPYSLLFYDHPDSKFCQYVHILYLLNSFFKSSLKCHFHPVWQTCFDTDLFECSWYAEEFIYGVERDKHHGGHGHTPAKYIRPVREDVFIILQPWRCQSTGYYHKL